MTKYYVYILCDPRCCGEEWGHQFKPFYVGKGCGRRAIRHLEETNKAKVENIHKFYKIQKIKSEGLLPIIEYYRTELEETDAYKIETELIVKYGRQNINNNGILTNVLLDSHPPLRIGPMPQEQKDAIAAGNKGKKRTKQQILEMSLLKKGKPLVYDLMGQTFGLWRVIDKSDFRKKNSGIYWLCKCSCIKQTERLVKQQHLTNRKSTCCGCRKPGSTHSEETKQKIKLSNTKLDTNLIDLTFGLWKVIAKSERNKYFICECSCPDKTIREILQYKLLNGKSTHCGCNKQKPNLIGAQFGFWTVINNATKNNYLLCKCICGNQKDVSQRNLIRGTSTNCGCWRQSNANFKRQNSKIRAISSFVATKCRIINESSQCSEID